MDLTIGRRSFFRQARWSILNAAQRPCGHSDLCVCRYGKRGLLDLSKPLFCLAVPFGLVTGITGLNKAVVAWYIENPDARSIPAYCRGVVQSNPRGEFPPSAELILWCFTIEIVRLPQAFADFPEIARRLALFSDSR